MSEQPKWTPGPWQSEATGREHSFVPRVWADGMLVANLPGCAGFDYANARLIAAAPELYEALLQVLKSIANRYYQDIDEAILLTTPLAAGNEFVLARNALAKARGDA